MTDSTGAPLDELQWRDVAAMQWYGGVNADNIHLYFLASPYVDNSSNNRNTQVQAESSPELFSMLGNREQFESTIKKSLGLNYLVEDGPQENSPDMNPVWVIRAQNRTQTGDPGENELEGTYFAFAETIYQAPSLQDVINCRLISITENLSKIQSLAAEMQHYSPTQGYEYSSKSAQQKSKALESMLDNQPHSPSDSQQQQTQTPQNIHDGNDERALMTSLNLSLRFRNEYVDENPLLGEPGSFSFTSTASQLKAQQQAAKTAASNRNVATTKSNINSAASTSLPDLKISTQLQKNKSIDKEKTPLSAKPKSARRRSRQTGSPED